MPRHYTADHVLIATELNALWNQIFAVAESRFHHAVSISVKKSLILTSVIALVLGAGIIWYVLRPRPSAPPDLADLRAQLDQAAARSLPLPELSLPQIIIVSPLNEWDAWEEKITTASRQLGATMRRGLDREKDRVYLVTLRSVALPSLRAALFSLEAPITIPTEANTELETIDCEVILRASAP